MKYAQSMAGLLALSVGLGLSLLNTPAVGAAEPTQVLDRIVAVVNDDVIVASALEAELETVVQDLQRRMPRLPPRQVIAKQVLDKMIIDRIQLQLAENTGIKVDDNSLNETLRKLAARSNLNLTEFREVLAREGFDFADFRENIREEMVIQRLRQRQVANKVNVSEREIDDFLSGQVRQGNLDYEYHLLHILISVPEGASPDELAQRRAQAEQVLQQLRGGADFRETAMSVSESSQALDGGDLGWRKGGEVPSLFAEAVARMQPGDVEGPIRNAGGFHIIKLENRRSERQNIVTQTHARHILVPTSEIVSDFDARTRLQQLRERLQAGEDFAALAQAHSEDPGSARNGGDLGWIDPGSMVGEFEEVMDSLQPGQISQPFRSAFGWHVLQVLERRNHDNTNEFLRNQATQQIRQRKVEEDLQTWLRQLREEAYVEYRLEDGGA